MFLSHISKDVFLRFWLFKLLRKGCGCKLIRTFILPSTLYRT